MNTEESESLSRDESKAVLMELLRAFEGEGAAWSAPASVVTSQAIAEVLKLLWPTQKEIEGLRFSDREIDAFDLEYDERAFTLLSMFRDKDAEVYFGLDASEEGEDLCALSIWCVDASEEDVWVVGSLEEVLASLLDGTFFENDDDE